MSAAGLWVKKVLGGILLGCAASFCLVGCGAVGKGPGQLLQAGREETLKESETDSRVLSMEELLSRAESEGVDGEDEDTGDAEGDAEDNASESAGSTAEGAGAESSAGAAAAGDIDVKEVPLFAYERLTEAERLWYRDIDRALKGMKNQELSEKGLSQGLSQADIGRIFQCVLSDHPEYFYVEGYTYTRFTRNDETVKLEFSGKYAMEKELALRRAEEIEAAVLEILKGISSEASDYDKVKYVYETLILNTEYDLNAPDNQNLYSVLVGKASVCQGYAKAFQYLVNRLGVECTMVTGTVDTGEGHAWNLVRVEDAYYYVDATWGDASYVQEETMEKNEGRHPRINYDYLCVTTDQLLRTHTPQSVIPLPVCTSLENNYYVREGVYFTEADDTKLKECFDKALKAGKQDVTLKCADVSIYEELYRRLITEQDVFAYLDSAGGSIAYTRNEKQLSMTFWVTKG